MKYFGECLSGADKPLSTELYLFHLTLENHVNKMTEMESDKISDKFQTFLSGLSF